MNAARLAQTPLKPSAGAIAATTTYDFYRLMEGATLQKCSEFADAIIEHMPAGVAVGS